jgi:hypothetical protein
MRVNKGVLIKSAFAVMACVGAIVVGLYAGEQIEQRKVAALEKAGTRILEQVLFGTVDHLGFNLGVEHVMSPKPATPTQKAESVRHEPNRLAKGDREAVTADRYKPVAVVTYRVLSDPRFAQFCDPACVTR